MEEGAHREAEKNRGEKEQGRTGTWEGGRPITEPQTEELRLLYSLLRLGTVFMCQGHRNKVPHTVWLNNRSYYLPVLESRSPRSGGQQGHILVRLWGGSACSGLLQGHWHVETSLGPI